MFQRGIVAFVGLAAMLLAGAAGAHHNMTASFDFNAPVTLSGPLTKVDWRNPHIEMVVNARVGDEVQTWSLEGPPPRTPITLSNGIDQIIL